MLNSQKVDLYLNFKINFWRSKLKKEGIPLSRKENIVVQELDGEVLIYDLTENKAFCLNQTSALVWQSCDGTRTIAEINDLLGKQLNSQVNEDVVWLALDQLSKENLIQTDYKPNEKFSGLSRREVIRKVGLASVIALPVVTSLVAPLAVHANSSCVIGGTCLCNAPSAGRQGQVCTASVPCTNSNCRCSWTNNGNANGTCIP
jgi:hypothetical protein